MTLPHPRRSGLQHLVAGVTAGLLLCAAPLHAQARLVTDMSGATVEIKDDAPPIADLWYAHNEISVMLGAAPRIRVTAENAADNPWLFKIAPVLYMAHMASSLIRSVRNTCWPTKLGLCLCRPPPKRRNCDAPV
ncbi:TroA family protein [Acetobacter okinawensis]|uniref:hypothetical protein n=1 Tax=Acetobacter okinawensis TaxID=1076594 RepID=UPI001F57078D|nr:hypothetical protein [Acetobacter okinawensis]